MASIHLHTTDNNIKVPLTLSESQITDLSPIAGKTLRSLGEGILVFPQDFDEYGDDIGKGIAFSINGNKLYTGNIMGFIGRGDTMVKIGSRFDRNNHDYFIHYMLERVLSINLFNLNYSVDEDEVFDFLPFLLPYYLKKALSQGIYKEYRTFERNDSAFRGVLDVNRHIRLNYPSTGSIAYKNREYSLDNNITELIRHTIEHIAHKDLCCGVLSNDEDTKTFVSQIIRATPSYNANDREKVINANIRHKIHPYYSEYSGLTRLCMQILKNEEIKYGTDDDNIHGVLFDGAWLWEEYLNTLLMPIGIKHPRNKIGKGGFALFADGGAWRYPDFMGDGVILDAKYKSYDGYEISKIGREDLAQVISYMYVQKADFGIIMSPGTVVRENDSELRGYGGKVSLVTLEVPNASSYNEFLSKMNSSERLFTNIIVNKSTLDPINKGSEA